MIWRAGPFQFNFPRPVLVMGIVNVTPDSFSDGGKFDSTQAAVKHALQLIEEGALILDIGGESTRPNATPVSEKEELRRVVPVIKALAKRITLPISIDTMKPAVAAAALRAGASIVNDVAANRTDDAMWRLVAQTGAGYVAMHMKGSPTSMQHNPTYEDVVTEVNQFFGSCLRRLQAAGVDPEQVVLDVGLGFGKSVEHNLLLLAGLKSFTKWKRPLLMGASRKSFLCHVAGEARPAQRLPAALACACWGNAHGVGLVRTHDVKATVQALRITEALLNRI